MSATVNGIFKSGRTGKASKDGSREYSRTYIVQTTSQLDDAQVVRNAVGIPRLFFPWVGANGDADSTAVCTEIEAAQGDSPYIWHVTCQFSTNVGDSKDQNSDKNGQDKNPLAKNPRIRFSHVMRQKIAEYERDVDITNDPANLVHTFKGVVPSNKVEPFDPPVMFDEAIPVLTITRNEDNINSAVVTQFVNTVNKDMFFGFQAGQCKIQNITISTEMEDFNVKYREVEYEIHIHPETWTVFVMDVGTKYWTNDIGGAGTALKGAEDPSGQPTRVLLNGKGGKLNDGDKPKFLSFKVYRETTFAALNLPQSF